MNKVKVNAIVDIIMFAVFVPCVYSAFVLKFVLTINRMMGANTPTGSLMHLGLKRWQWRSMHDITGWIFIVLVIIHLLLHLRWIMSIPKFFKKS